MNNNFYIRSVTPDNERKGTTVSYSANYPLTGNTENGTIFLTNEEYLTAMQSGTVDDISAGIVKVLKSKIVAQNSAIEDVANE